jgi:hypothetical protein
MASIGSADQSVMRMSPGTTAMGDRELETCDVDWWGNRKQDALRTLEKDGLPPFHTRKAIVHFELQKQLNYWIFTTPHRSACLALTFNQWRTVRVFLGRDTTRVFTKTTTGGLKGSGP